MSHQNMTCSSRSPFPKICTVHHIRGLHAELLVRKAPSCNIRIKSRHCACEETLVSARRVTPSAIKERWTCARGGAARDEGGADHDFSSYTGLLTASNFFKSSSIGLQCGYAEVGEELVPSRIKSMLVAVIHALPRRLPYSAS